MNEKITSKLIINHKMLFVFSLLVTLVLAFGISRNNFNTSITQLLSKSDPYLSEVELLSQQFPSPLQIFFAFTDKQGASVFSPNVLNAIEDLHNNFSSVTSATRLSSLFDYRSPEQTGSLFTQDLNNYDLAQLQQLEQAALQDPYLVGSLLSTDAKLSLAIINLGPNSSLDSQRMTIADNATALKLRLEENHPSVNIYFSSDILLQQTSYDDMFRDLSTLLPIIILICVLCICFCFRSLGLGICILIHICFTLVCVIGLVGFLGIELNEISIIAPMIVSIIAIANSVHLISLFKQDLGNGATVDKAIRFSLSENLRPISLAAITTVIGFASLNLCSSPAIQDFGTIVSLGICFAYMLSLLALPSLLIAFAKRFNSIRSSSTMPWQAMIDRILSFVSKADRQLFWGFSLFAIFTLALLPLNKTDFNRFDFIDSESEIRQYYDVVSKHMNRDRVLSYGLNTELIDAAIEPEFLARVEAFSAMLLADPQITSVNSLADVVKTIHQFQNRQKIQNQQLSQDGQVRVDQVQNFYTLPNDINTIAEHLNNYELLQNPDFALENFINDDFSLLKIFISAAPLSNQQLIILDERINQKLSAAFPELQILQGSWSVLFARMNQLITVELLQGYTLSLALITLCIMLGLGSVYFGLLSIIPNILPATIVFGLWGLFVGQLDPFVLMLFSISIGLIVDDTVHILCHYLSARKCGANQDDSFKQALSSAGPALAITTGVIALGTTILIGANTLYFQQAAKLLVPIVVLALVLDSLYLPTILKRFDNKF